MASLAEEIQACILRSFCFDHAMTFEHFHSKFTKFAKWLAIPMADKIVIINIFPTYPNTLTVDDWNFFSSYMRSEEGAEYHRLCHHWPKYAKLCLEQCNRCYLKVEGTGPERYVVGWMYVMSGCMSEEERHNMESQYPENYGTFLLRQARKRKRLVDDVDRFLVAPDESQGST